MILSGKRKLLNATLRAVFGTIVLAASKLQRRNARSVFHAPELLEFIPVEQLWAFLIAFVCICVEHSSCVGEVATAFQHSSVKRQRQTVWLSVSSGPQVRPQNRFYIEAYRGFMGVLCFSWYMFWFLFRICLEPASVSPHEWPDDITKWPVSTFFPLCVICYSVDK